MSNARLLNVIVGPHVSEKSTLMADKHNEFVFRVRSNATKDEVRKAVEMLFEVVVTRVTTLNVKGKRKRFAAVNGIRKGWKKAYVTLQEGDDIEFAGVA